MATTENTDDTILDEELDENEFTFDNENEDALLAETEYDFVEATEKRTCNDVQSADHLEAEEDVLDIGIAEEDIVEAESNAVTQATSPTIPNNQITLAKDAICDSQFTSHDFNEEERQPSNESCIQKDESDAITEDCEYSETKAVETNDAIEFHEKDAVSSSIDEIDTSEPVSPKKPDSEDKYVKSTVISLKKIVGKNYDNLPALAKVIEKVQPTGSSAPTVHSFRNRKLHGKEHDNDYRDNGSRKHGESAYKRRYDHDDSRRRIERRRYTSSNDNSSDHHNGDLSRHLVELDKPKWMSHSEDSTSQKYEEYAVESTLESNQMTHQLIDERTRYENTSTGFAHQSIVASVQITQERYHITSDVSVPVGDGSFNRSYCDFGANTTVSLPPPPGIRPMGGPQPLLHPPRPGPPFMANNMMRPHGPPGIRNPGAPPFFRSMPPPRLAQPPPAPLMNRPPLMSGPPPMYNNPQFGGPHSQMPFPGPPHQMRPAPPPSPQPTNGPLFPPPAPNPHFQQMPPPHMRPDAARPPPNNFGPPMGPMRCPPPFRQFAPPQQMQGPRMAPNFAPRMPMQPARLPFANSAPSHPNTFPAHGGNSTPMAANTPPAGYQQPPPPGVHSNLHLPPPPLYQSNVNEANYSHYESNNQHVMQQQQKEQQQQVQQTRPFYPNSEQLSCRMSDYSLVRQDSNTNNLKRGNVGSADEAGGYKQTRYDFSATSSLSKKDEDEEMMLYREKVEHQKKLREKFVQNKEEQRLKNQMQSFIQNNIKGILEKREQFLRKSEDEFRNKSEGGARTTAAHKVESSSVEDAAHRRVDRSVSSRTEKVVERGEKWSAASKRVPQQLKSRPVATGWSGAEPETAEKTRRNSSLETAASKAASSEQRQLHKVIKIKYKDGTVAFKSIPVHSSDGDESNVGGSSDGGKSLMCVDEESDRRSSGAAQRRMVVAKRIPVANVKNDTSNENAIVESIRKGVTQSSVPLAQRFANLRAASKPLNARPL